MRLSSHDFVKQAGQTPRYRGQIIWAFEDKELLASVTSGPKQCVGHADWGLGEYRNELLGIVGLHCAIRPTCSSLSSSYPSLLPDAPRQWLGGSVAAETSDAARPFEKSLVGSSNLRGCQHVSIDARLISLNRSFVIVSLFTMQGLLLVCIFLRADF